MPSGRSFRSKRAPPSPAARKPSPEPLRPTDAEAAEAARVLYAQWGAEGAPREPHPPYDDAARAWQARSEAAAAERAAQDVTDDRWLEGTWLESDHDRARGSFDGRGVEEAHTASVLSAYHAEPRGPYRILQHQVLANRSREELSHEPRHRPVARNELAREWDPRGREGENPERAPYGEDEREAQRVGEEETGRRKAAEARRELERETLWPEQHYDGARSSYDGREVEVPNALEFVHGQLAQGLR
ncbi:hypothetical protein JCM10207_003315 [Rhodosporidiobolus poonsookiae]